jgi:hypothetical protein
MTNGMMPDAVYALWMATVLLALVVFVPIAAYSLNRLLRTARSIRDYARDAVGPAQAIAASTAALPALDETISVATEVLSGAEAVAAKIDAMATVLEARSARLG